MAAPALADAPAAAHAANTTPVNQAPTVNQTHSRLIYFSSASENTKRFIEKLGAEAARIPLHAKDEPLVACEPFVLVVPTYGGTGGEGSVPKQVIRFLNNPDNRRLHSSFPMRTCSRSIYPRSRARSTWCSTSIRGTVRPDAPW